MKSARAFTLIELLVVISIISLLSSVVLASLNTAREKARLAAGKQFSALVDHAAGDQAVAIYELSECTGSTTADRSLNGYTGTLNNGASWNLTDTPTGTGCSVSFNGTVGQNITAPNPALMNFGTGDFSFSLWMKTADNTNYKGIISKGATIAADIGWKLTTHLSASNIEVYIANGTTYPIGGLQSVGVNMVDNNWHHVAFSGNRTGLGSLYIDGKLNNTQAFSDAGAPTSISGTSAFSLGSETNSRYLNGLIYSARVYAKTISASEVEALYAAGARELGLAK